MATLGIKGSTEHLNHITAVLHDGLHSMSQWIEFKMESAAFDCFQGTGPAYFKDVCTPVGEIGGRSHLGTRTEFHTGY